MENEDYNDRLYRTMCNERTLQSDKNGFFMNFAEYILQSAGPDWLSNKFAMLQTDRERIETLFTDEKIKFVVWDTLQNVQCVYRKKDAKISRERRLEGEEFMKQGDVKKALMLFCQSVLRAPMKNVVPSVDNGLSLALALWGRSEVLMDLGHIKHALNDIQVAQREGLPDEYKAESFSRLAQCYYATGENARAKVALGIAKKMGVDKIPVRIYRIVKDKKDPVPPKLTGGKNESLEGASSLVEVKESPEMGRYLVAKKPICTGDVLLVTEPVGACLLPECFGSHCHHCFKRLLAPLGCPDCSGLAFCSVECRDLALGTYHKHECKILDLLIGSGMSVLCHVALRMVTQAKEKPLTRDASVYKLVGHWERRETKDLLQRTLMAAFLLRCLQVSGFFQKENINETSQIMLSENELKVGEMLLTNLMIQQFNAHEIYETVRTPEHKFKKSKTKGPAVALYPTASLLNHECCPAVLRYFVGRVMVICASRPLKPGEMIAENYGPIFLKRNLAERQRSLLSRYWFKCQCVACKEDWPGLDTLQNSHARLRCPNKKCDSLFPQLPKEHVPCPRCKQIVNLKEVMKVLKNCEEQLNKGIGTMDDEKPEEAIIVLRKSIDKFYSIASPPHKDTHLGQEALRTCLADTGNVFEHQDLEVSEKGEEVDLETALEGL